MRPAGFRPIRGHRGYFANKKGDVWSDRAIAGGKLLKCHPTLRLFKILDKNGAIRAMGRYSAMKHAGFPVPKGAITPTKTARNRKIVREYMNGKRCFAIARDHGITRTRVTQILGLVETRR